MDENLLPDDDMETFIFAEDMMENTAKSISVVEGGPRHAVARSKLSEKISWYYSNKKNGKKTKIKKE